MHFPHSVTIDGETYIHKERCEREQAERDVEYRKLERDWQHLGKRVLELQRERDLLWAALHSLGWEAVEPCDGGITMVNRDGRCIHARQQS